MSSRQGTLQANRVRRVRFWDEVQPGSLLQLVPQELPLPKKAKQDCLEVVPCSLEDSVELLGVVVSVLEEITPEAKKDYYIKKGREGGRLGGRPRVGAVMSLSAQAHREVFA